MNPFDEELERGLRRVLDPVVGSPAPARRRVRPRMRLGFAAAGIAILIFAAAASEAVVAQSLNPVDWSQQVRQELHIATATPASTSSHQNAAAHPPSPNAVPPGAVKLPVPTPPALPSVKPTCLPVNLVGGGC